MESESNLYYSRTAYPQKKVSKVFILKKPIIQRKEMNEIHKYLFTNPKSFLVLPNESKMKLIVGKIPSGPKFDESNKLVPYSIVGGVKFYQKKPKETKELSFSKSNNRSKKDNEKENNNNNYSLYTRLPSITVSDKEVKDIFSKYKEIIKNNQEKYKNYSFTEEKKKKNIKRERTQQLLDNFVEKKIELQERNLRTNINYIKELKKIEKNITNELWKYNHLIKYQKRNVNIMNKDHLLMTSTCKGNFKPLTKTRIDFVTNTNSNEIFNTPLQKWSMSLRRPQNFSGIRKKIINVNSEENPLWCIATEKHPKYKEYIINSRCENENSDDNFNKRVTKLVNINKSAKKLVDHYLNIRDLKIKGKNLLDMEENIYKKFKGNKRLIKLKFSSEEISDMNIFENYNNKGHSFA